MIHFETVQDIIDLKADENHMSSKEAYMLDILKLLALAVKELQETINELKGKK